MQDDLWSRTDKEELAGRLLSTCHDFAEPYEDAHSKSGFYFKAQTVLGRAGLNRLIKAEADRRGYELVEVEQ